MNENRYTETIGKLKLSDEALAKGIERMKNYEDKGKVVNMKSRFISIKTVVAAVLVLALGVGAVFAGSFNKADTKPIKNTFTLTANAQELTYDNKIEIGGIDTNGLLIGCSIKDGVVGVGVSLQIPMLCEGRDVESITYAVKDYCVDDAARLCFMLRSDYAEKMSFENITDYPSFDNNNISYYHTLVMHREYHAGTNTKPFIATAYTVAYDEQPNPEEYALIDGYLRTDVPVTLSIQFDDERESLGGASYDYYTELYNNVDNPHYQFLKDSIVELFEKHSDEMKIYVTVNFTDGTSQSQTIQLYCEPSDREDKVYMNFYGMLVD